MCDQTSKLDNPYQAGPGNPIGLETENQYATQPISKYEGDLYDTLERRLHYHQQRANAIQEVLVRLTPEARAYLSLAEDVARLKRQGEI